jgi:hypothetical protein
MERNTYTPSLGEVTSELGGWATAGGVLTVMLFPVAVPLLALTALVVIPLVVPLVLLGAIAQLFSKVMSRSA